MKLPSASNPKIRVTYATKSPYKREEVEVLRRRCVLQDKTPVESIFEFDLREVHIVETLEVDLEKLVIAEVTEAYRCLRVPCVVEHAGLIFDEYRDKHYPGGLTKAMWNALGDKFVDETHSAGRHAIARAVVAYCDGSRIETFTGETRGVIVSEPRGRRDFYWDTVFAPEGGNDATYAEIVDDPTRGLEHKITELSQSTKAILSFLEFRRHHPPALWPRLP